MSRSRNESQPHLERKTAASTSPTVWKKRGRKKKKRLRKFKGQVPVVLVGSVVVVMMLILTVHWIIMRPTSSPNSNPVTDNLDEDSVDHSIGDNGNDGGKEEEEEEEENEIHVMIPDYDNLSASTQRFIMARSNTNQNSQWTAPNLSFQGPPLFESPSFVIVIMSARSNGERRMAIRETWKKKRKEEEEEEEEYHHNIFFLISAPCWVQSPYRVDPLRCEGPLGHNQTFEKEQMQQQLALEEESRRYRDMIYIPNRPESYRSLAYKLKFAYEWVATHLSSSVQWVVKADDDMFVRVDKLEFLLDEYYHNNNKETYDEGIILQWQQTEAAAATTTMMMMMMIGCIENHTQVQHEGKWKELDSYTQEYYPPWPKGSCGHVVSRPVFEWIAAHQHSLVEYQGEDSSLGIWFDQLRTETMSMNDSTRTTRATTSSPVLSVEDDSDHFRQDNCTSEKGLEAVMIGHNFTPTELRRCEIATAESDDYEILHQDQQMVLTRRNAVRNDLLLLHNNNSGIISERPLYLQRWTHNTAETPSSSLVRDTEGTKVRKRRLVVMVFSQQSHFLFRQVIRNTWASTGAKSNQTSVMFFLLPTTTEGSSLGGGGGGNEDHPTLEYGQLMLEQFQYRDMVELKFPMPKEDSEIPALSIALSVLRSAFESMMVSTMSSSSSSLAIPYDWHLIISDRMYVRLDRLEEYLIDFSNNAGGSQDKDTPIMIGNLVKTVGVDEEEEDTDHDATSSSSLWPDATCGFLVNQPVARTFITTTTTTTTTTALGNSDTQDQWTWSAAMNKNSKQHMMIGTGEALGIWLDHYFNEEPSSPSLYDNNVSAAAAAVVVHRRHEPLRFQKSVRCTNKEALVMPMTLSTANRIRHCYEYDQSYYSSSTKMHDGLWKLMFKGIRLVLGGRHDGKEDEDEGKGENRHNNNHHNTSRGLVYMSIGLVMVSFLFLVTILTLSLTSATTPTTTAGDRRPFMDTTTTNIRRPTPVDRRGGPDHPNGWWIGV